MESYVSKVYMLFIAESTLCLENESLCRACYCCIIACCRNKIESPHHQAYYDVPLGTY